MKLIIDKLKTRISPIFKRRKREDVLPFISKEKMFFHSSQKRRCSSIHRKREDVLPFIPKEKMFFHSSQKRRCSSIHPKREDVLPFISKEKMFFHSSQKRRCSSIHPKREDVLPFIPKECLTDCIITLMKIAHFSKHNLVSELAVRRIMQYLN